MLPPQVVIAGLVPAIQALGPHFVDARIKSGHDNDGAERAGLAVDES
jgi:hypothetical protein